ncbi:hypothetical protein [Cupriavidus sp. YAF13]|uniref:hypothetical protein n=1 Tax=Cupriavidus sp. YAF13 TaxID=3233075 RepID=UPI003F9366C1
MDPVNGSDSNKGGQSHPYRSVGAAMTNTPSLGCIWLKPGTYTDRLDLRASQNMIGNGSIARAVHIKAWGGPGSVTWRAPGAQPGQMEWHSGYPTSTLFDAVPPGGEFVSHIVFHEQDREVQLQWYATAAEVNAVGSGWSQNPSTKRIYLRHENRDFTKTAELGRVEIMYERPADHLIYGAKLYLEGIAIRGDNQLSVIPQNGIRPIVYAKDCRLQYLGYHNLQVKGGEIYLQNCLTERSLNGDGLNYNDDDAGRSSEVVEIDCIGRLNGVIQYRKFTGVRNCQGSSGHGSTRVCRINGVYEGNYGQNIADTGHGSKTWMVGSKLGNASSVLSPQPTPARFYANLWTEGDAWLDHVQAVGAMSPYGLWIENGSARLYRCPLSGTAAAIGGRVKPTEYNPAVPMQ